MFKFLLQSCVFYRKSGVHFPQHGDFFLQPVQLVSAGYFQDVKAPCPALASETALVAETFPLSATAEVAGNCLGFVHISTSPAHCSAIAFATPRNVLLLSAARSSFLDIASHQ
jgi:hypothetical protein